MSTRVRDLARTWGLLQDVGIALSRVFEMMAKMPEEKVRGGSLVPALPSRELAFDRISFAYDARSIVLNSISLRAKVGEITAVAGPSGSGKST